MTPTVTTNAELFARARPVIPGGVNSPVRAFGSVGGTPVLRGQGRGPPRLGRRGPPLHRPRAVLRRDHRRPRPPRRSSTPCSRRRRRRHVVRRADRARGRCWPRRSSSGCRRSSKVRLVISGTEATMTRHPGGPRLHRPAQAGEVRRQLPRPRRRAAGRPAAAAWPRSACPARAGRHRRRRSPTPSSRPYNVVPELDDDDRVRDRRAGRRQHGPGRPGRRVPRGAAGRVRPRRRAADLRRGDHRLPRGARRRPGAASASRPTSRASARSSAAACRSVPSAVGPT